MSAYPFRDNLARFGLPESTVKLIEDLMDHDNQWSHREAVIRRLDRLPEYVDDSPVSAWASAYISFQCDVCTANQVLRYFGFEIAKGEMENYRISEIQREAA